MAFDGERGIGVTVTEERARAFADDADLLAALPPAGVQHPILLFAPGGMRSSIEFWRSYNARDWDAVRRGLADTLTVVDHRLASAGSMIQTADQFLTYTQEMVTLVPDVTAFDAEYLAIGRVWTLSRHTALGTSTQAADVEFAALVITDTRDGRFTHSETFAPEQLAEALTRFEELETVET